MYEIPAFTTLTTAGETNPLKIEADALVVPYFAEEPLSGIVAALDLALGGMLSTMREAKELSGKYLEATFLPRPSGVTAKTLLLIGLGTRDAWNVGRAYRVAATAIKALATKPRGIVAMAWSDVLGREHLTHAVAGAMQGGIGQDLYRKEKKLQPPESIVWLAVEERDLAAGKILGESIYLTRRLVNEPADVIYPETFAEVAKKTAKECGLEYEVWDECRLEKERCGSLMAVAKGSSKPPRLVMLKYVGAAKDAPQLALVGKGVTFDSGGLSLKTPDGMLTMKCDMAGAATALGAIAAIAKLKLPINVSAYVGLVENMTGPAAMKLGDVLHARSGKTIEVHNTDAEGRLVLADVLDVARERGAARIVDLATLTGACVVALGTDVAGAMTNEDGWQARVIAASRAVGEPLWPLPMFPEFDEEIAGNIADIKNVGNGRWGGAITAAKFLEAFVGDTPWVHLDIAGPAFYDKVKPWSDAGASGMYVRTLVELAKELANETTV